MISDASQTHAGYYKGWLELAEEGQFADLKNQVQDELGYVFRGCLDGGMHDQYCEKSKIRDVIPTKRLKGGFYVIIERKKHDDSLKIGDRLINEFPVEDFEDLEELTWRKAAGDQSGRTDKKRDSQGLCLLSVEPSAKSENKTGKLYYRDYDCESLEANKSWDALYARFFILVVTHKVKKRSSKKDLSAEASQTSDDRGSSIPEQSDDLLPSYNAAHHEENILHNSGDQALTAAALSDGNNEDNLSDMESLHGGEESLEELAGSDSPFKRQRMRSSGDSKKSVPGTLPILWMCYCSDEDVHLALKKEAECIKAALKLECEELEPGILHELVQPSAQMNLRTLCQILQASIKAKPFRYIHFAGHGGDDTEATLRLCPDQSDLSIAELQNVNVPSKVIPANFGFAQIIAEYQKQTSQALHGLVLNCCHSLDLAQKLCNLTNVSWVLAHDGEVADEAAIAFAEFFWGTMAAANEYVEDPQYAFDYAIAALKAKGIKHQYKLLKPAEPSITNRDDICLPDGSKLTERIHHLKVLEAYKEDEGLIEISPPMEPVSLRDYQKELIEACSNNESTLVCLPTGAGKTMVAFHLMLECIKSSWGLKAAFLAPTIALTLQQARAFQRFVASEDCADFKADEVGKYCGDTVNIYQGNKTHNIAGNKAFFSTAGLFRNLLQQGLFDISDFSIIVVDEAHNARGQHDYAMIMKEHYFATTPKELRPKIIGLTATPADAKSGDLAHNVKKIIELCLKLGEARLALPEKEIQSLNEVVYRPPLVPVILENEGRGYEYFLQRLTFEYIEKLYEVIMEVQPEQIKEILPARAFKNRSERTMNHWIDAADDCVQASKFLPKMISCILVHIAQIAEAFVNYRDCGDLEAIRPVMQQDIHSFQNSDWMKFMKDSSLNNNSFDLVKALLNSIEDDPLYEEVMSTKAASFVNKATNSNKFGVLQKVLTDELSKMDPSDKILIFVKTRWTAKRLDFALKDFLKKCFERTCEYVVGHGRSGSQIEELSTGVTTSVSGMSSRKQAEIISRFGEGKTTVLIATSVVEEGIDVGHCKLVIRYDNASTTTALQQSRGRARAHGGKVILLTEDKDEVSNFLKKEKQHEEALRTAKQELRNIQTFTGPRTFLEQDAKSLLNRYCQQKCGKLPTYRTESEHSVEGKYTATVTMPCGDKKVWPCFRPRRTEEEAQNIAAYMILCDLRTKKKLSGIPPGDEYLESMYKKKCINPVSDAEEKKTNSLQLLNEIIQRAGLSIQWSLDDLGGGHFCASLEILDSSNNVLVSSDAGPTRRGKREAMKAIAPLGLKDLHSKISFPLDKIARNASSQEASAALFQKVMDRRSDNYAVKFNELLQLFPGFDLSLEDTSSTRGTPSEPFCFVARANRTYTTVFDVAEGRGLSKKAAKESACENALKVLNSNPQLITQLAVQTASSLS